ncbi:MAG: KamA family radical SAM protein [Myxococcota bacterium]
MARLHPDPVVDGTPWAGVDPEQFDDWGWQQRHRIRDLQGLEGLLALSPAEREGLAATERLFRFGISPYYALLAEREGPGPMRRQMIPLPEEATLQIGERRDPLGEEGLEVVPNLVHRYPDRVLLLATDRCPVYCRFCTRRRIVGRVERQAPRALLAEAFAYIHSHPEIREVIVSGGDALMLADRQLDHILGEIRRSAHVDIIRIATRMPVTCPMRVSAELAETLARHGPVFVMTHFNHPRECTPTAARAVDTLVRAGLPVWNQSVLLRGVNDDLSTIEELNRLLVWMKVTPYYLHQCDLAEGIEHFRTPLATGVEIIDGLRGHVSGLMVPKLCVDVPGGLGKVTLQPDWIVKQQGRQTWFRTYGGQVGEYLDPY